MSVLSQFKLEIKDIGSLSTQLDKCDEGALVFYKLGKKKDALEKFKKRLRVSRARFVIVCGLAKFHDERVHFVNEDEFNQILRKSLDEFYPIPAKRFIAVTGTNGKTSTVHLIKEILLQNKRNVLSIGTLGTKINSKTVRDDGLTTPGICEFRRVLFDFKDQYDDLVMEVSSHALDQDRVYGVKFDVAGWTNLSQDHLDYHQDMESYFKAKLKLVDKLKADSDLFVSEKSLNEKIHRLGVNSKTAPSYQGDGVCQALSTPFARANLGLAIAMLSHLGVNHIDFSSLTPPPGRFQAIAQDQVVAIIDYAHTPDALLNACSGVRQAYSEHYFITVFGCGGDRDKTKRPLMAKVAQENSDLCIVTSDNPRTEDPDEIIKDITNGFSSEQVIEADRKRAIELALKIAGNKGMAVVLIAGKGHETYQEINGVKYPFDDSEIVKKYWGLSEQH